jgi:hypothetical protein
VPQFAGRTVLVRVLQREAAQLLPWERDAVAAIECVRQIYGERKHLIGRNDAFADLPVLPGLPPPPPPPPLPSTRADIVAFLRRFFGISNGAHGAASRRPVWLHWWWTRADERGVRPKRVPAAAFARLHPQWQQLGLISGPFSALEWDLQRVKHVVEVEHPAAHPAIVRPEEEPRTRQPRVQRLVTSVLVGADPRGRPRGYTSPSDTPFQLERPAPPRKRSPRPDRRGTSQSLREQLRERRQAETEKFT